MAAEITYNGSTIAALGAGQTATLACAGKLAVSDIVVSFDTNGSITFNGVTLKMPAGKTATLACAGKEMPTDVVVATVTLEKGVRLLTADGYAVTDLNGIYVTTKEEI